MKEAEFGWKTTDKPGILAFSYDVPNPIQHIISQTIKAHYPITGAYALKALEAPTNNPVGRYKLSHKQADLFVRITTKLGFPILEQEITQYLTEAGMSVNPIILGGIDLVWEDTNLRLDIRPLVLGRHFNYSVEEFRSLCLTLRDCHQVLNEFPLKEDVKTQASIRFSKIYHYFESIVPKLRGNHRDLFPEYQTWADNNIDCFKRMAEGFNPNFHLADDAQCLHGEIHLGNVIFNKAQAILIDFEESVYTFASPTWDIAYLLQRFCYDNFDDTQKQKEFLDITSEIFTFEPLAVYKMMQQLAWFSLVTLLYQRHLHDTLAPVSEYQKFVRLEAQARELMGQ